MKRLRLCMNLLTVLPFAAVLAATCFLPDEVPAHFGFGGEADRYGSKYELFILAAIVLLARLMMAGLTRLAVSAEKDGETRAVMDVVSLCLVAFFDLLTLYFIWVAAAAPENINDMPLGIWQLTMGALGIMFVPMGLAMPRFKRSSVSGFRTKWSMMNDEVWALSQRFAGRSMVIAGAAILICAVLLPGAWSAAAAAAVLVVMLIADCRYAKKTYFRLRGFED